jgi:hypothetical protein
MVDQVTKKKCEEDPHVEQIHVMDSCIIPAFIGICLVRCMHQHDFILYINTIKFPKGPEFAISTVILYQLTVEVANTRTTSGFCYTEYSI